MPGAHWRKTGAAEIKSGLTDIALVTAADPAEEALAIALALREALDAWPQRRAGDARPQSGAAGGGRDAPLGRGNSTIPAGLARHITAGTFLCLLAEAADAHFAPVPLLALLKHPFARRGEDGANFRAGARELDRWCLRGPRPDPGLAGITAAIAKATKGRRPPDGLAALATWWGTSLRSCHRWKHCSPKAKLR